MTKRAGLDARMKSVDAAMAVGKPAAKGDDAGETVGITIRLPKELHERLRRVAFDQRVSINSLVVGAVEKHVPAVRR